MDRKNFGRLVASLRKENIDYDETGEPWGQDKLAEVTGISKSVISNLERGIRVRLDESRLNALAMAFNLTSGERRAFIREAQRLSLDVRLSEGEDLHSTLAHCEKIIGTLQTPTFLMSPYFDLFGANAGAVQLFKFIGKDLFDASQDLTEPPNLLAVLLDPDIQRRFAITSESREFMRRQVLRFRETVLPHRHSAYYVNRRKLIREASKGTFEALNIEAQQYSQSTFNGAPFTVQTPSLGGIKLIGIMLDFPTEHGIFLLVSEVAADSESRLKLNQLMGSVNSEFVRLFDWSNIDTLIELGRG